MSKHKVKKSPFITTYVPDWYETKQMCDKTILENDFLGSIPDCYKDQKMCNQAVNNYVHALEFVSECCRTCKIFDKAVNTYFLEYNLFLNDIRLRKCVIKLLISFLYLILFSIGIKLWISTGKW